PLEGIVGQDRALKALKFGLEIKRPGFNVYVSGIPGTGRKTTVTRYLEDIAKQKPVPADWCYVNNFKNSYEPKAITLPPGKGKAFQKDMAKVIEDARRGLTEAFESEDYATRREAPIKAIEEERSKLFTEINRKAQQEGFVIQSSPIGLVIIPVVEDQILKEQDFQRLPPEVRDEIQRKREKLASELRSTIRQLRSLDGKANEELKKLNHEVAHFVIDPLFADLKEKYKDFADVVTYLEEVQEDISENVEQFVEGPKTPVTPTPFPVPWLQEIAFRKYEVNVIVDNSDLKGAPVVLEHNPTYQNLFGRIEKEAQFGALTTDLTMIRTGSLHKANGGYLVIPAEDLFRNILSWIGLKTSLKSGKITVEEPAERFGYISARGLKPEAIPLDIKVVLIGSPYIYSLLYAGEMDFKDLFKVKADFDTTMDRTGKNIENYASFICTFCEKEGLKHLDQSAVAKVVEYGSKLAADQQKLSTRFADISNLILEANFYAEQDNSELITAEHIEKAIEEKKYRSNLIQDKMQETIERDITLIDVEGEAVGQVNGLSVLSVGDYTFGRPSRVTASTSLGRDGIIDIERESELGGNIHTKGVMILGGYLANKYAQDKPLSLSARLVFEQSYSGVEGDSASSTELYAILSSLSGVPIKQCFAVTGSVNQRGEVQAIGGVNYKIEGFFDVCKAKGLAGEQGVLIPESNVQHLMLKEEVVQAVKEGKFHIYPVKTIDQGIEILTEVKPGERQPDGTFEEGTINYLVDKRLKEMAEKMKEFQR
ncbi:MAG: AAA family ATPase, partial [Candidatus Hodarchaeota archaeon]